LETMPLSTTDETFEAKLLEILQGESHDN
ncbi:ABC transporter ATP-binding protein, partial [Escherichia coli]|nr:ABC transporter ATP-binding protein [Escherichia coli]